MQIVWNKEAADRLRKSHTVLELETIEVTGVGPVTTYCVVPTEKILGEMTVLASNIELHQSFLTAYKEGNNKLCRDIAEHLLGKFGGELDSYYNEILKRIT